MEETIKPRAILIQDGSRGHYGLALALQRAGMLEQVFTDWYAPPRSMARIGAHLLRRIIPLDGQRAIDRYHPDLRQELVTANPLLKFRWWRNRKRFASVQHFYEWQSDQVAGWVKGHDLRKANVGIGFVRNISPHLLRHFKSLGMITIGDQIIAPATIETHEARTQAERWPQWVSVPLDDSHGIVERCEQASWEQLDHILVASEYVRSGLIRCGVSEEKISLLPYPIDDEQITFSDRGDRRGPIEVGFVGQVGLRKGAPYFLTVANRVDPVLARFTMVGPVAVEPQVLARHCGVARVVGPIARSQIPDMLKRFDVFFFPSTCEGSALALMEAMAAGLPVITSPNSGTVARHGVEGFIASYDAIEEYVQYLERLAKDRELRLAMGAAARRRYEAFNIEAYSQGLAKLIVRWTSQPQIQGR